MFYFLFIDFFFIFFFFFFLFYFDFFFLAKNHRRIFEEIGFENVVKMCKYKETQVLKNMANVFLNLIQLDQNKVKMIKDGGILFLSTLVNLVKDSTLGEFPELENFLSRGIAYLCEQPHTIDEIVPKFGTEIFIYLLSRSMECQQSAARSLAFLSSDEKIVQILMKSDITSSLLDFITKTKDIFVKRSIIMTLANLSNSKEFEKSITPPLLELFVDMALITDTQINVHAAHIIANISSNKEQLPKIKVHLFKILELSNFTQIRYDWESSFLSLVPQNELVETISDQTSEINFYFIKILANFITLSSK